MSIVNFTNKDIELNSNIDINKAKIIKLLRSTNRENIESVINYLESSNFFRLPASIKYHQNWLGGLAEHSLSVYENLKRLNDKLELGFREDSMIIVSLLHDICKCDNYEETEEGFIYKTPKGHGIRSAKLAYFLLTGEITDEEISAIGHHMGAYERKEYTWNDLSIEYRKYPLCFYLHVADMQNTYSF